MRTSDDLRAALIALEDDAPTVEDVLSRLEVAHRPVIGHRRHWLLPAATAALVAAALVPTVVLGRQTRPDRPAAAAASGLRYSFSVAPVAGFTFTSGSIAQGRQQRGIRNASGVQIGTIEAGGSFVVGGNSALTARHAITVSGHSAFSAQQALEMPTPASVSSPASGPWRSTVPVVAWRYQPGSWLVVRASPSLFGPVAPEVVRAWGAHVRARLVAIADAIRTDEPAPMLLPFGVGNVRATLTTIAASSDTASRTARGGAVLVEYGMEVTVNVSRPAAHAPVDPSASPVTVGGHDGRVNTRCAVEPAPTADRAAQHSDCQLTFRVGQWQIDIFVAGPGGGSRKITPAQFIDIGAHLRLARNPNDPGTWFDAGTNLPR